MVITLTHPSEFVSEATTIFGHLGIKVVTSHCFLGGFIGDSDSSTQFVSEKIQRWVSKNL